MSRVLPADVDALVRPVPDDFGPVFKEQNGYVEWTATLRIEGHGPLNVHLGFSLAANSANRAEEEKKLRAAAWQAMEIARLGRIDLLSHCVVDRHSAPVRQRVSRARRS